MTISPPRKTKRLAPDFTLTIRGRRKKIKTRVLVGLIIIFLILLGLIWSFIPKPNFQPLNTDKFNIDKRKLMKFFANSGWDADVSKSYPRVKSSLDTDKDGINDLEDILLGARAEAGRAPSYKDAYYKGGYPPATEGVCTDVIWRAFKEAGYDLKAMVDQDIKDNIQAYPRVGGKPDLNIDFRRVPNLTVFFKRHADSLTTTIKSNDRTNLSEWQGGDIVVFDAPKPHIGIVSDHRRSDGVPLLIHNAGPVAAENDMLTSWPSKIIYHFRFNKK